MQRLCPCFERGLQRQLASYADAYVRYYGESITVYEVDRNKEERPWVYNYVDKSQKKLQCQQELFNLGNGDGMCHTFFICGIFFHRYFHKVTKE